MKSTLNIDAEPPLVEECGPALEPCDVFLRLAGRPHCLFLDSALRETALGRYSFVAADPFGFVESRIECPDSIAELAARLAALTVVAVPDLPPFQGGAAGLFSYDLARQLERLPAPRHDEFGLPAMAVGLYDVVVAFDHARRQSWIISQGLPETEPGARRRRARERLRQFRAWLSEPPPASPSRSNRGLDSLAADQLITRHAVEGPTGLASNFSRSEYLATVCRAIDYIQAGDIFQVNLSQRLLFPAHDDTVSLYLRLRQRNAAPFAAYFDLGAFQIASASPERFLSVKGRQVEARPIKGTRRRSSSPEADLFAGDELRESEKDRAENIMIVDLLRNDLSRVCRPESVHVSELCRREVYRYVQHLVSVVRGHLSDDVGPLDLIRATFPGGSVTGAPKIRAMEIIAELEPSARGAYCGALGYMGFDGSMDTSILIRTITAGRGWWQAPVGGGIVAQSSPAHEYAETWHKAEGLLQALT